MAVRRTLRVGTHATIEGLAGVTDIRFDVSGQKARTGVRLGKRATLAGILWAPATKVQIGRKARVASSVQAAEVRIGTRARIGTDPEAASE